MNVILTVQEIAREALAILKENLVFPNLIHTDYSKEFVNKGDTIQVKKPPAFDADEFDSATGINIQDIKQEKVLVKMDKIADVSIEISSKDRTLAMPQFRQEVLDSAAVALAEKINRDGLDLYKDIPYFAGVSGTTPDDLSDMAEARKVLNKNKVPLMNRRAVWDPDADAKFSIIPAIVNAEKSGSVEALREGAIGRIQGMNNYMSQAVKTHTAGGYTALDDVTVTATAGDTTITMESAAGVSTAKLLKGDIFILDGNQYVVTEDTADAVTGNIASVKIYPAIKADVNAGAVTFADATAGGHVANLAFHKNAFAFVTRSMELPKDKEAYVVAYNGLTLRVVIGYDMTYKKTIMSIDVLYGYKTLHPELAVRYLG